jgi:hypothetical protein
MCKDLAVITYMQEHTYMACHLSTDGNISVRLNNLGCHYNNMKLPENAWGYCDANLVFITLILLKMVSKSFFISKSSCVCFLNSVPADFRRFTERALQLVNISFVFSNLCNLQQEDCTLKLYFSESHYSHTKLLKHNL